jgi:hypothetical protein
LFFISAHRRQSSLVTANNPLSRSKTADVRGMRDNEDVKPPISSPSAETHDRKPLSMGIGDRTIDLYRERFASSASGQPPLGLSTLRLLDETLAGIQRLI